MFDEFRSNLLLLLACKYPQGMPLDRLESEYSKYFCQKLQPYMFSINAITWLEVITETPLQSDTKMWGTKSEMYIQCIAARTDWEMMQIAKLAKHSHFQFAQKSQFQLENCDCCSRHFSVFTNPYDPSFNPSGVAEASCLIKEADFEDEHLDRGCFMGIIAPHDDELVTTDFLEPRFISSCEENCRNERNENDIFGAVKTEATSPNPVDTNYTPDYLINSDDLNLANFNDINVVKLESDSIYTPSPDAKIHYLENVIQDELNTPDKNEEEIDDSIVIKEENFESQTSCNETVAEKDHDPDYEPEPEDESLDKEDEYSSDSNQQNHSSVEKSSSNTSGPPYNAAEFACQWKDCTLTFPNQPELVNHIQTHTAAKNVEIEVNSENVVSVALCQKPNKVADAEKCKTTSIDQPKERKLKPQKGKRASNKETSAGSKNKRKCPPSSTDSTKHINRVYNCNTMGCNRTFETECKWYNHQKRCCAINDFSCQWVDCTKVLASSLELHNHVKIEHRKCTDNVTVPSAPGMIEKNLTFNCTAPSCGHSFTCEERLATHEKQCTGSKNSNGVNVRATTSSPNLPSSSTTVNSKTPQPVKPKGFARVSKYPDK